MAAEKPEKKEKKDKKAKRSETEGITKSSKKDKKDKKDKEKKKLEKKVAEARHLDEKLQAATAATAEKTRPDEDSDAEDNAPVATEAIAAELVPFAIPIADEKYGKKVLKSVRKSAKSKTLKRGVKEVVKTLRKSPSAGPSNLAFPGVVIIAADISPMDVISHLPVLCEDHNVPYIFVTSRAELGAAGATKRPTSVVMVCEKKVGGKKDAGKEDEGADDFSDVYKDLVKLVQKETLKQVGV